MPPSLRERLFHQGDLDRLLRHATLSTGRADTDLPDWAAADVEILLTGWGTPALTDEILEAMPRLRSVLHAAGSVKHHLPDSFWRHGIAVSSAADANAAPVAEYTLAVILLAGKRARVLEHAYRRERRHPDLGAPVDDIGNYAKRVGLVGASKIGRKVARLLAPFDLEVVISDPYLEGADAAALGATVVDLDELFATSDVVSLHAPDLPETRHLADARRLALMKPGATLVNTARGALVDTEALTEAVAAGRLDAVLDVTDPPLLDEQSPLWTHPNVVLTPHIAGSLGTELWRIGALVVDELERVAAGQPLSHQVQEKDLSTSA